MPLARFESVSPSAARDAPGADNCAPTYGTSWREIPPRKQVVDVSQAGECGIEFARSGHQSRHHVRDLGREIAQLDFRQAQEFVDRQQLHPLFWAAPIAASMKARAPAVAGAPLVAGTKWMNAQRLRP